MCINISTTKSPEELMNYYQVEKEDALETTSYFHVNSFSHPTISIIDQSRELVGGTWGMVQPKHDQTIQEAWKMSAKFLSGANARVEKLDSNYLYKKAKRCIIPVNGFFESHLFQTKKYPFFIGYKSKEPLSLAGLYLEVQNQKLFSIITRPASSRIAFIHNKITNHNSTERQPAILPPEFAMDWISEGITPKDYLPFLSEPQNDEELLIYSVSDAVNKRHVDSNHKDILEPVWYQELITNEPWLQSFGKDEYESIIS